MAKSAFIKLEDNNDNLQLYQHPPEYLHEDERSELNTEALFQFTSLERQLTEMVWQDDSDGLISLVKQNSGHSQESPCSKEDEGLDPSVAARLLQLACKLDSVSCAQVLIEGQTGTAVNMNEMDGFGRSPLHNAAEMLSAKCIDLLLQKHAYTDLRSKDGDAFLPLEIALASQRIHVNWSPNESVEKLLVSLKVVDLSAIRLLVEATKNLTELSYKVAVAGQVIELSFLLLVAEDKVMGAATFQGENSLSTEKNKVMYEIILEELLKLLEMAKNGQRWKSVHRIYEKRRALLCQIELLHLFGVASMISWGNKKAVLPLLRASQAGDELLVELLLKQNVDVGGINEDGNSSLHCFLKGGTVSRNPRILRYLLKHGAKICEHDKSGLTPVHLASLKGNYVALEILLLHAPECVDILSLANETPLFLAVKNNSVICVKLLLQFGACRDALNIRGQGPIELALFEEMHDVLRTVYSNTFKPFKCLKIGEQNTEPAYRYPYLFALGGTKISQDDGASCRCDKESSEDTLKSFLEPKKNGSIDLDEKIGACLYFYSPYGCGRGNKYHYSHGEEAQKFEMSGVLELTPKFPSYNEDPACLQHVLHRKILGGVFPPFDSVNLKKRGPVEDSIVIRTKDGDGALSKGFSFLTFKQENARKMAVKARFNALSGETIEIKSFLPKCRIILGDSCYLSDHKTRNGLDEINDRVPTSGHSNYEQLVKISELPPWVATFKKWLPTYLEKACERLGEGEWYPLSSLKGDFRATCGMELDHEALGFLKLSDFLRSLPGICRMHMISTGSGSPTHMVLQPFCPFPCKKPENSKHIPSPALHSSSSEVLSLKHSSSMSEFSDSTYSSNESILHESVPVAKSGLLDGNPNVWMWEHMPDWLAKPGSAPADFLEYNLWKNVRMSEEEAVADKRTQPFSFFAHQWDSGLLARCNCIICKNSPGIDHIGVHPHNICRSGAENWGFDEEFPSLGGFGFCQSSSISHRDGRICKCPCWFKKFYWTVKQSDA